MCGLLDVHFEAGDDGDNDTQGEWSRGGGCAPRRREWREAREPIRAANASVRLGREATRRRKLRYGQGCGDMNPRPQQTRRAGCRTTAKDRLFRSEMCEKLENARWFGELKPSSWLPEWCEWVGLTGAPDTLASAWDAARGLPMSGKTERLRKHRPTRSFNVLTVQRMRVL